MSTHCIKKDFIRFVKAPFLYGRMILALLIMTILDRAIFYLPFVIPFIFHLSFPNPYEFPKFIFFTVTVQLLLFARIYKKFSVKDIVKRDALFLWVLGFVFITYIADIFGIDPKISILGSEYRHQGFVTVLSGLTLFLLARGVKIKKNRLFFAAAIAIILLAAISLWQAVAFYLLNDTSVPTYHGRIIATMGNPNFLGGFVAILLPFVFLYKKSEYIKVRVPLVVLVFLTIVLTQSVSSLVAFFLVLLFTFWKKQSMATVIFMLIPGLIIAGAVASVRIIQTYDIGKTKLSLETQSANCLYLLSDESTKKIFFAFSEHIQPLLPRISFCEGRGEIWKAGIQAVAKRPFLGYGQENFELIFPEDRHIRVDSAHNIFLETAVSSGLAGLSFFLMVLIVAMRKAIKPIKVSLFIFLIVAFFNPVSIAQIAFFWFLLGLSENGVILGER